MLRTLAAAVTGAAGAVVVATLLSPLAPTDEARLADPAPGLSFDGYVIGLGALATVVVVLVLGVPPAVRGARVRAAAGRVTARRPSAVAGAVAAAGAPAGAAIGVRYALDPGRGTRAVPVRTALTGSVAAVAAICATAVFGTSLAHLTATPALYGAPFQMYFAYSGPGGTSETSLLADLEHDHRISQITLASVPDVTVNHVVVRHSPRPWCGTRARCCCRPHRGGCRPVTTRSRSASDSAPHWSADRRPGDQQLGRHLDEAVRVARGGQAAGQEVAGRGDPVAAEPDVGGHLGPGDRRHREGAELTGLVRRLGLERAAQEQLDAQVGQLAAQLGLQVRAVPLAQHVAGHVDQRYLLARPDRLISPASSMPAGPAPSSSTRSAAASAACVSRTLPRAASVLGTSLLAGNG